MLYSAVVFDLDGTLLDTIEDLAAAMNSALRANGLPERPIVAEHKYMVGDGLAKYVLRALPQARRGDQALIARVTTDYRAAYARGWRNKTKPYPGVPELLAELDRRRLRLAVLSNKPDDSTRINVEAFFGVERFDVVRGAIDGAPLKPDPAAALGVAEAMGVDPSECLYVGDTATDMHTAKAAGMFPVGALWGFREAEELKAAGARALARTPADVLQSVGQLPDR